MQGFGCYGSERLQDMKQPHPSYLMPGRYGTGSLSRVLEAR
jgi:hypothetical protein